MSWRQQGPVACEEKNSGDPDDQVGRAWVKTFTHPDLPGRQVEVRLYPAVNDVNNPDLNDLHVEAELWYRISSADAPDGTGRWSDVDYDTNFDVMSYPSVEEAEKACRTGIERYRPERIDWDGSPS